MLLGTGEIDQCGAVACRLEQAHVDLQTTRQAEADLVFASSEHVLDLAVRQDVFAQRIGFGCRVAAGRQRNQQVEVADRFLGAAQGTRGRDRSHGLAEGRDMGGKFRGFALGEVQQKASGRFLDHFDGLEDVGFAFLAEAGEFAQFAFAGQIFDLFDSGGFEGAPEKGDLFGAERLNVEEVENRGGIFFQQFFAQGVVAVLEDFADVLGHAVADAGELGEFFFVAGDLFDGLGEAGDQFGGALVTAVTADKGAVDLEKLGGLPQDARDIPIFHGGLRGYCPST